MKFQSITKKLAGCSIVLLGLLHSNMAISAEQMSHDVEGHEPTAAEMVVDATLVRPVMLATTAVGGITFVATLPFSLFGGNADAAAEKLLYQPAKRTFKRCLGCK